MEPPSSINSDNQTAGNSNDDPLLQSHISDTYIILTTYTGDNGSSEEFFVCEYSSRTGLSYITMTRSTDIKS